MNESAIARAPNGPGNQPKWCDSRKQKEKALQTQSYFCEPYHSWEKGSVEQGNGLIRRFFPKGTDFNSIPLSEINRVEKLLNNRPRICLDYRTPYEVYREACGALTG